MCLFSYFCDSPCCFSGGVGRWWFSYFLFFLLVFYAGNLINWKKNIKNKIWGDFVLKYLYIYNSQCTFLFLSLLCQIDEITNNGGMLIVFFWHEVINMGCWCSCEQTQRLAVIELLEDSCVGYTMHGPWCPEMVMGSFLLVETAHLLAFVNRKMPRKEVPKKGTGCVWKGKRKLCGALVVIV